MLEQIAKLKSTHLKKAFLSESSQIIAAKLSGCTIGSYESASCTLALPMYILDLTS